MNFKKVFVIIVGLFIISTPYWGYKIKDHIVYGKLKDGIAQATQAKSVELQMVKYNKRGACGQFKDGISNQDYQFFLGHFEKNTFMQDEIAQTQSVIFDKCIALGLKLKASE